LIEVTYTIAENALIASGVYRLRLEGDTSAITAPGQFLDLRLGRKEHHAPL
jgi:NAD(P)H-flavin reductase